MADASPIQVRHEGAVTRVDFTEARISDEVVIHRIGQELLRFVAPPVEGKLFDATAGQEDGQVIESHGA